jgi:hypothetical protein
MEIVAFNTDVLGRMPDGMEIHDAIICGTALAYRDIFSEDVAVITRDRVIRTAGIVPTIW